MARFWDGMRVYNYTPPGGTSSIDGGTWTRIATGGPFSDADGYDDPSLYLTIKAADVDGEGKAELVSRTHVGVAVYDWNASGWSPGPTMPAFNDPGCTAPACYLDLRTADVTGSNTDALIGRDGGGVSAWSASPQGSPWQQLDPSRPLSAPFMDQSSSPDCVFGGSGAGSGDCLGSSPAYYETLQLADIDGKPGAELLARASDGLRAKRFTGNWVTYDDANPALQYGFPSWDHNTGVVDAIDHTESVGEGGGPVTFNFTGTAVQVIGPTGPDLGEISFNLDLPPDQGPSGTFQQNAQSRHAQQVMFTATRLTPGPHTLTIYPEGFETAIDAIKVIPGPNWTSLATLGDLAGAASAWSSTPGKWASIQTANLDGQGGREVLALDGDGLQAWTYNAGSTAWSKLAPSTPLGLGANPWLTHPEYYSTIHTGDVDGDGRDDVIARGPYGIRTWFYNRRGTGGWERYLADGYPAFSSQGAQNEQNAFAALNALAIQQGLIPSGTLRDVWAGENPPQPGDLTRLVESLPGIANCGTPAGNPPQVASCTPPAGSTGFTGAQWTAVVNQMLAESDAAGEVLAFFSDLHGMRDDLFLQENAELPAIGDDLGLQAAAGNTAQFNPLALMSGSLGIAASLAGLVPGIGPELSAALWVAAEATSMIPQTSPTATSSAFPSTYAGLQTRFATMVSETEKGMAVMSQQVRQDASLLGLVSQLRASGPWATNNLDTIGMESAANQGFAIWVYQTLMPTVYDRYDITQCAVYGNALCYGPSAGTTGVIGGATSQNNEVPFNFIAPGPQRDLAGGVPCKNDEQDEVPDCTFTTPPSALLNSVWGTPSDQCTYVPGKSGTAWTFGCNAGVNVQTSIGANTWNFTSHSGSFDVSTSHCGWPFGGCGNATQVRSAARVRARARTAQGLGGRPPIRLGRPRSGRRRPDRGRAQIRAEISMPRGMRLAGATVRLNRLLFEPGYRELTAPRARRGEQPLKLRLSRVGAGRFAAATRGRRPVRVTVHRERRGGASLTVTSARVYHTPRACHALPASVALKTRPLWLHTRLVISDGHNRKRIELHHHVRCRRDARGNVDRLEYVRYRHHRLRPGLAVTLRGPRSVTPGAIARYVARVHNRRHGRDRIVSSLWDITLIEGARTQRIHELRRGRTRTVSFTVSVPRSAGTVRVLATPRGRFCVGVGAGAPGARANTAHVCSRVRATLPPRFTG